MYMHRNYTVLCVSVSNTCCDLCFVSFCFCVLLDASVDNIPNQSVLKLTFAVCFIVTVPYFYYNLISMCLSSFMCHAMSVVYNANPNAIITFGEKTVMVILFIYRIFYTCTVYVYIQMRFTPNP